MANQPKIGGKIVLDGEKEYKQALSSINSEMRVLQSEVKKVSSEFGSNQNSIQAITAKNEVLTKQYETQKNKVNTLQDALKNAVNNQNKISQSTEKYKSALADAEKEMERMKNSADSTSDEIEKQQNTIDELKKAIEKSEKAYVSNSKNVDRWQTSLNNAEAELNNMENSIKDNTRVIQKMEEANVDNVDELKKLENQLNDTSSEANTFGDVLKANIAGEALIEGVKAVTSALTDMTKAMISVGSDFEASMSQVQAVSGATGSDFDKLNDKAKQMGASTKFTASEAADAFNYMAMAGWKTQDMLGGIDGILNLAAAGAEELGTTSDIVTDALTAFGESADQAGRLADVMAAASSNANTNIGMMGETFKYAAPLAGTLGYSMEDTAVAIGLMANSGIKASQAGTSLRATFQRMSAPPKAAASAMDALNFSMTDSNGQMKSLRTVMDELRGKFSTLSESEKILRASQIAGSNAMSGFLAIINAAPADYEKLTKAVDNSSGAAKNMADVMQNNLQGEMTKLQSATEGLGIAAYDKFGNVFKNSVKSVTDEVSSLTRQMESGKLGDKVEDLATGLGHVAEKGISLAIEIIPHLIDGFNFIVDNGAEITSILEGIATAMMIQKAVATFQSAVQYIQGMQVALTEVTAAQEAANAAANMNPYVLLASVIGGVVVALGRYAVKTAKANKENDEMYQKIKKNKDAIAELNDTVKENDDAYADNIASAKANAKVLGNMADKLYQLNDKENKSVAEKCKMQAIVEELNQSMPELNLAIDEQTGKLNLNKKAVEDGITALKEQAKQQAIQDRYAGVIDEQVKAQETLFDAQINLSDAQEKYNEALAEEKKLVDEINNTPFQDKFSDEYNDMIAKRDSYHATTVRYKLDMEEAQEAVDSASEAVKTADSNFDKFDKTVQKMDMSEQAEQTYVASEKTNQLSMELGNLQDAYEDAYKKANESIKGQISLFDEFSKGEKTSIEQLQKNLDSNIKGMQDWRKNLSKISKTCSAEFVSELESMGMGASAQIEALANATPEQLKKYEKAWKKSQKEVEKTVEYSCKDIKGEIDDTKKDLEKSIANDNKAVNAVKNVVSNVVTAGKKEASKSNEIGKSLVDGISSGLEAGISGLARAGERAADSFISAAKKKAQIHSPSRKTKQEVGIPLIQGISSGIDMEIPKLQEKMRYAINVSLPKVKNVQNYSTAATQQSISSTQMQDMIVNTVKAMDIPNTVVKAINNSGIKVTYKDETIGNIVADQFIKEVRR